MLIDRQLMRVFFLCFFKPHIFLGEIYGRSLHFS